MLKTAPVRAMFLLILLFTSGLGLTQSRSASDQIVINTQRLYDLERRMTQIERGGSDLAGQTAARVTINDIQIQALAREISEIRSALIGVAVFTFTNLVGFVIYMLKNRFSMTPPPRPNSWRSRDV